MEVTDRELIEMAREARTLAYVPYSGFLVGAAVEDEHGQVFTGCNIENASYGATICAERTAIFKAISAGSRKIKRLAVVCGDSQPCMPCGICRQVMAEFAMEDFTCLCATGRRPDELQQGAPETIRSLKLDDLLPNRFSSESLYH